MKKKKINKEAIKKKIIDIYDSNFTIAAIAILGTIGVSLSIKTNFDKPNNNYPTETKDPDTSHTLIIPEDEETRLPNWIDEEPISTINETEEPNVIESIPSVFESEGVEITPSPKPTANPTPVVTSEVTPAPTATTKPVVTDAPTSAPSNHIHAVATYKPITTGVNKGKEGAYCSCGELMFTRNHKYIPTTKYISNEDGTHKMIKTENCVNCSDVHKTQKTENCRYDKGVVVGNATVYTCIDCGYIKVKINSITPPIEPSPIPSPGIPSVPGTDNPGHIHAVATYKPITTGVNKGKEGAYCSCGKLMFARDHKYVTSIKIAPSGDGHHTITETTKCVNCKDEMVKTIKEKCQYDSGKVVGDKTIYTCTVCGHTKTVTNTKPTPTPIPIVTPEPTPVPTACPHSSTYQIGNKVYCNSCNKYLGTVTTPEPTVPPTSEPTVPPTSEPTVPPTSEPTVPPTSEPTVPPTSEPTVPPTSEPTVPPTSEPTPGPVETEPSVTNPVNPWDILGYVTWEKEQLHLDGTVVATGQAKTAIEASRKQMAALLADLDAEKQLRRTRDNYSRKLYKL